MLLQGAWPHPLREHTAPNETEVIHY